MKLPDLEELIQLLELEPLVGEGGLFRNTYISPLTMNSASLPSRYHHCHLPRPLGTAIYYLLTPNAFSHIHKLASDEIYHFYLGDPVELLELEQFGKGRVTLLGQDLAQGMKVQHCVPHGTWQGLRLKPGGRYGLLGTTMSPGYTQEDYEISDPQTLLTHWPAHREMILSLTGDMVYK